MTNKALALAGGSVALAVGTYAVLNAVWPFQPSEERLPANPTIEAIYAGSVDDAATPATEPAAEPASGAEAPAPASASTPADAPAGTSARPEPADEPADASPPAADLPSAPAPEPVPEPAPAPEPATPPAPPPAPPSAPEPAKPKPAAPRTAAAENTPRADALSAWWPSAPTPGKLNLLYAGQAAETAAIALLFDSVFADTAAASTRIQVLDAQGQRVAGDWELASNRRLLLFKVKPGRYTVLVEADLSNARGVTLAGAAHGPVYIR